MNIAARIPAQFDQPASLSGLSGGRYGLRTAVDRYRTLDSTPEADFDNIAMLAAQILGTQSAAINFLDDHRQWFKARFQMGPRETSIAASLCALTIKSRDIVVTPDVHGDGRFASKPPVKRYPCIRFYAGMRILATDGTPVAVLCAFGPDPRPQGLTEAQQAILRHLALQVQSLLELRSSIAEGQRQVVAQAELSKKLQDVADRDVLTGLPHRGLFHKRLLKALRDAKRSGTRVMLMLVDVDHFKQINDSLGHDVGDALLCSFANRLRQAVRSSDTVARLGGDEFGVLLCGTHSDEEIMTVVRSFNERFHKPMTHRGRQVNCSASIGVAIFPDHALTAESLTKCSDLALSDAKRTRGSAKIFCHSLAEEFEREARMLLVAREGVESGRILAYYQPKIDLNSGRVVGFEALLRCNRPGHPPLLPESFAQAFVDRELALAISRQMIARVLDDIRAWVDQDLAFGHVAINTGPADFHADDFAERLLSEIELRGLRPSMIELEVTEGVFLGRGSHHVARALSLLSERGMRIALDDFGTGFASLVHLKQLRVDVLKIDRSFVAGIGQDLDDTAIVRALIGLGTSLGIMIVAEGIETPEQAHFVRRHGCDIGQGFLFSPARPPEEVPAMIALYSQHSVR